MSCIQVFIEEINFRAIADEQWTYGSFNDIAQKAPVKIINPEGSKKKGFTCSSLDMDLMAKKVKCRPAIQSKIFD